jgi:hypothetical protein
MSTEASPNHPQVETQSPSGPAVPEATHAPEAAAAVPPTAVRLEGLAEALQQARSAAMPVDQRDT